MGLDMYLEKKIHIGWLTHTDKFSGEINIEIENKPVPINIKELSDITLEAGYWRKANQIHKWFVDNIQDGKDDCETYYVPREKLLELLEICKKVITYKGLPNAEEKCEELLPTQSGFFFGNYEYDDWYFSQIQDTIDIIQKIDFDEIEKSPILVSFYYTSSW